MAWLIKRPGLSTLIHLTPTYYAGLLGIGTSLWHYGGNSVIAAHRHGRPEWEQGAREIIAFWVDRSVTGLCHTEWDRAGRGWVDALADVKPGAVFLRDQSEARVAALDALDSVRTRGQDEPG